jgi:hypothetical protein
MEANTHQLANEIGNNYPSKIIYLALSAFIVICLGFMTACYIGYYFLRKNLRQNK